MFKTFYLLTLRINQSKFTSNKVTTWSCCNDRSDQHWVMTWPSARMVDAEGTTVRSRTGFSYWFWWWSFYHSHSIITEWGKYIQRWTIYLKYKYICTQWTFVRESTMYMLYLYPLIILSRTASSQVKYQILNLRHSNTTLKSV